MKKSPLAPRHPGIPELFRRHAGAHGPTAKARRRQDRMALLAQLRKGGERDEGGFARTAHAARVGCAG